MKLRSGSVLSPENVTHKARIPTNLQKPSTNSKDYRIKKKKLFASSISGSSSSSSSDSSSGSEVSEQPSTSNKPSSNVVSRKENIKSLRGSSSCKNVKPSESLKTKLSKPRKVLCAKTVSKHTSVGLNQNKPKSAGVSRLLDKSVGSLSDSFDNLDISGPRRLCRTTKVHSKNYKNSRAEAVKPTISSPLHRLSYSSDSDDTDVDRTKSQKNTLAKTSKIHKSSQKSTTKSSFKSSQLSDNKSNKSKNSSRSLASGYDSIDVEMVKCSTTVKNLVTKTNSGGLVKTIPVVYIDSSSSSDNLEELISHKQIQTQNKTLSNKDSNQIKYNKKLTNSNTLDKLPVSNCNLEVSNQIIPIICLDNSLETSKSLVINKQSKEFDADSTTFSNAPSSVVFKCQPAEPLLGENLVDKIKNSSSRWESITACKDTNVNNKDTFETECTRNKSTACESKGNKSDTLHKNTPTVDDSIIKPANTIQAGHTSAVSKSKSNNILPMIPPDFKFKPYKPTETSTDKQPVSNTTNSNPRWNTLSHCKGKSSNTAFNEKRKFNRWDSPCKDKSWRSPASKKIKCPSNPYNNAQFANQSSTKQPGYQYSKNGNTAWQNNNYNVNTYHSPWWVQKYSTSSGYVNTNTNPNNGAQYKTFPSNNSGQYGYVWQNNNQLLDNSQKLGEHVRQLNNQLTSSYNQISKKLNANVVNNTTYSGSISHLFPSSSYMGSSSNGNTSHKAPAIPCTKFNDDNSGTDTIPARSSSPVNMFGGNIYLPSSQGVKKCGLRPIVIDGSNVAMGHGNGSDFSYRGLQICISYFVKRGHKVMAFLPQHRKCGLSTKNKQILTQMEKEGHLIFTPSRRVDQRLVVPYDDWFIVQCAAVLEGVIVSNDNYRDLLTSNSALSKAIKERLLMYTWVGNLLMFPNDPMGRYGPTLDKFLRFP